MMDKLDLAWQTFEFYTHELNKYEEIHFNVLKTLKRFVLENPTPQKYQRIRVHKKCQESYKILQQLYKKQMSAINDLIDIYENRVDIPKDKETDISYFLTLKNITATLMHEVHSYKTNIEEAYS